MKHRNVRPVAFACAAMMGLAVGGLAMAQKTASTAKPSKAQLVAELAATLQACSYDGSPLAFSPPDLSKGGGSGKQVVAEIMKYTGLPANFVVVEGKVPNAAAVIMQGPDQVPRRVIAYNPAFMGQVIEATKSNNWAPVSIMAHEIGHHLSGHTIVPGGSQPRGMATSMISARVTPACARTMPCVLSSSMKWSRRSVRITPPGCSEASP